MPDPSAPKNLILSTPIPFAQHPAAVYLASLTSEESRRVIAGDLRTSGALLTGQAISEARHVDIFMLNWAALRYPHLVALRARLLEHYSPASTNRILSALRGVLKAAWELGAMTPETYHESAAVHGVKPTPPELGRTLSPDDIGALVAACRQDSTPAGARDAAIIGLLYTCGLRRAEVVALNTLDFDPVTGQLTVTAETGQHRIDVEGGARQALGDWLRRLDYAFDPLFVPVLRNGALDNRRMSARSIYDMLRKRAAQADVGDVSPHDFRRTFVLHHALNTAPLEYPY